MSSPAAGVIAGTPRPDAAPSFLPRLTGSQSEPQPSPKVPPRRSPCEHIGTPPPHPETDRALFHTRASAQTINVIRSSTGVVGHDAPGSTRTSVLPPQERSACWQRALPISVGPRAALHLLHQVRNNGFRRLAVRLRQPAWGKAKGQPSNSPRGDRPSHSLPPAPLRSGAGRDV